MGMYKHVKNRLLRWLLLVPTILLGLLVGYWLFVYLITPRYQFREGPPFHGECLYNPYQDLDPDQWKQCNFHCHSRKHFGLTDGRLSKEEDIDSVYRTLGYDHYGISDYMHINTHGSDRHDYLPAYEHGYGFFHKTHQLCLGAESMVWMDYPFVQSLDMKQHLLNVLQQHCRFAIPAHAPFYKGYRVRDMRYLSGYRLLEVGNPYGEAFDYWDAALSTGHRVYGIGDDDTHNVLNSNEVGRYFTMVNTPDMQADSVYEALEKGHAYTVKFHPHHDMPFEYKAARMHDELYHLTRCELIGDSLVIETSAPYIQTADFIGQDGRILKHEENVWKATYTIQPTDTYVRVNLMVHNMTFFYLNPITRHATLPPTDPSTATVNTAQTMLFYLVYLLAIALCAVRIVKRPKS